MENKSQQPSHPQWDQPLSETDPVVEKLLKDAGQKRANSIELLAPSMIWPYSISQSYSSSIADLDSEGYVDNARKGNYVNDFTAFQNDYIENGSSKYNPVGEFAEYIEAIAEMRIAKLFSRGTSLSWQQLDVNVQPLSGSIANIAVLEAILRKGDSLLSIGLSSGGHLSHGAKFHHSGKKFVVDHLDIGRFSKLDTSLLIDAIETKKPKAVIIGASSYPYSIDWFEIRKAIDELKVRPYLIADIAHFCGLVATGHYQNPIPFADVVTLVGYKSLGGSRSGVIITSRKELAKKIRRALFPGIQSSPFLGSIVGLAVSAKLALSHEFESLIASSVEHASQVATQLKLLGYKLAFGGSDTHMFQLAFDSCSVAKVNRLERAGIFANTNLLPGDPKPSQASGIRFGLIGLTQRGFKLEHVTELSELLDEVMSRDITESCVL